MYKLLLVTRDKNSFSAIASAFVSYGDVELLWADSGSAVLDLISNAPVDLVVADEDCGDMSGLDLAFKMLSVNPMINCAVLSALTHDDFHEASEGLGLLAQLSLQPDAEQAEDLLLRLKKINNI